jgi:Na+-transporting methylmalonyl-CoA/oxaloacetate decarboxylase gamma subunit
MKKLVGGSIAILIGIVSFSIFLKSFFVFILGVVPIVLVLSGATMIYLKRDLLKFWERKEKEAAEKEAAEKAAAEKEAAEKAAAKKAAA